MNPHSEYSYLGYGRYPRPESPIFTSHKSTVQFSVTPNFHLDNLGDYSLLGKENNSPSNYSTTLAINSAREDKSHSKYGSSSKQALGKSCVSYSQVDRHAPPGDRVGHERGKNRWNTIKIEEPYGTVDQVAKDSSWKYEGIKYNHEANTDRKGLKGMQKFNSMGSQQEQPTGYNEALIIPKSRYNQPKTQRYNFENSKSASNLSLSQRLKAISTSSSSFKDESYMNSTFSGTRHVQDRSPFGRKLLNQSMDGTRYKQIIANIDSKPAHEPEPELRSTSPVTIVRKQSRALSWRSQSLFREPRLQDFTVGECKGQGRFGKVFMAIHKATGFICALKKIKKESVRFMLDQFIQEVKIQMFLNHPKLVKIYGYFADHENFYMLVEYMEQGSLYSLMKKKKKFQEPEAANKILQICQGIKQMHSQNIVHRDLKPQNVVMSNGVCKICDFGWAAVCQDRRQTYCGTLDYVCPEIAQGNAYDSSVDIWCIGVLAYQLMCGKAPFYDISRQKTIEKIKSCKIDSFPSHLSRNAVRFIEMILQKNPDARVDIDELLRSEFLKSSEK